MRIQKAVVTRANAASAPFKVPHFPDMHQETSEFNKSYYIGPTSSITHIVKRTYYAGNSIDFKAGINLEIGIPADPAGVSYVNIEIELSYTLSWTARHEETFETEYTLSDPNGLSCYVCSKAPIHMADGVLNSTDYVFWFVY